MSNNKKKSTTKFVLDMQYGISKSNSCLISEISRSLEENIKLKNTIERLCDNLVEISYNEINTIKDTYIKTISKYFPEKSIAIFNDSDIDKRYGKKFEDLDRVMDASSPNKEILNGYHVCEAVILWKSEKQPFSVYSEIYSCKSSNFKSMNKYTLDSIDKVISILKKFMSRSKKKGKWN